jgi:hypothetical protein
MVLLLTKLVISNLNADTSGIYANPQSHTDMVTWIHLIVLTADIATLAVAHNYQFHLEKLDVALELSRDAIVSGSSVEISPHKIWRSQTM